jgi:hypothetical protein
MRRLCRYMQPETQFCNTYRDKGTRREGEKEEETAAEKYKSCFCVRDCYVECNLCISCCAGDGHVSVVSSCPYSFSSFSSPALNSFESRRRWSLLQGICSEKESDRKKTVMASKLHLSFRDCVCRLESHTNQGITRLPALSIPLMLFVCMSDWESKLGTSSRSPDPSSHPTDTNASDGNFFFSSATAFCSQTANSIFFFLISSYHPGREKHISMYSSIFNPAISGVCNWFLGKFGQKETSRGQSNANRKKEVQKRNKNKIISPDTSSPSWTRWYLTSYQLATD